MLYIRVAGICAEGENNHCRTRECKIYHTSSYVDRTDLILQRRYATTVHVGHTGRVMAICKGLRCGAPSVMPSTFLTNHSSPSGICPPLYSTHGDISLQFPAGLGTPLALPPMSTSKDWLLPCLVGGTSESAPLQAAVGVVMALMGRTGK